MKKTLLTLSATLASAMAFGHGSMIEPPSRQLMCSNGNIENPQDPACAAAKAVHGTLAGYDPYAVAQGSANGNHRAVVPDGKLCSGNAAWYPGYDLVRDDWQATPIQADANGQYTFRFLATAPHKTRDWIFYVTKPGYNNEALTWDNIEEFARIGEVPLQRNDSVRGAFYEMTIDLPQRSGKHVIFNVWQRSDSGEAFYTCMDVEFPGGSTATPWQRLENLQAKQDLPAGSTVSFRLFDAQGQDVDKVSVTLSSAATSEQWPYDLALAVNSQLTSARIGQLNGSLVTPIRSASGNSVYVNKAGYGYVIEIAAPVIPTATPVVTAQPTSQPTAIITPQPTSVTSCAPAYQNGVAYKFGDQVTNNGKVYQCKQFGWCGQPAYAPGNSLYWKDAWTEVGQCSNTQPTQVPTAVPTQAPTSQPTVTTIVTTQPTSVVTSAPTQQPTALPTAQPTAKVTDVPLVSDAPVATTITIPNQVTIGSFGSFAVLLLPLLALARRR
ncbi:lytic polysaccharide monooxygenase [Salinibius halmophilus]|uniref:lytic polysaccharide monooxygenase n=1 Tax=Salinibius halmophilus TaxID=1853216 RepID=UPI000E66F6B1|nr:lytic polysaccharide monooxygenase [Salinibius halmophilus]